MFADVVGGNTVGVKRHKTYARDDVEKLAGQRESGQGPTPHAIEDRT
jgi:hypothetical protein